MNSSTGFKKRSLLRPPSGLRQREREYLKAFDISQTQPMIANQVKNELIRIQDQINELDKDKKIRSGEGSSLQKSYILTLKKWLRESSTSYEKQDDDGKIMKYMGVESYEAGFRKLWKVISSFDQIISKITELQIIQLLKYDQTFLQLSKDSQKSDLILSTLSKAGFTPGTFQVSQVQLQRNKDLYSVVLQSKRKGGSSFITTTQKQSSSSKKQTNQLILQLQKQNSKLSELLDQLERQKQNSQRLMKQLKSKEEIIKVNQNIANNATKTVNVAQNNGSSNGSPTQIFRQLDQRYSQRISHLSTQITRLQSSISEQKITIGSLQSRLKMAQDQLKQNDMTKGIKPKSGSYQQALLQEMQKMKKGFEKKIQKLLEQHGAKEKELRKKEIEYRNDNEKVKWEKNLLLKKFDAMEMAKGK